MPEEEIKDEVVEEAPEMEAEAVEEEVA